MALFGGKDKEKKSAMEVYGDKVKEFLLLGEEIESIYPLVLDFLCVTNKRLIFVDKEISFKEPTTSIITIPYKNITGVGLVKNQKLLSISDELIIKTYRENYKLKFLRLESSNIVQIYNEVVGKIL
ncbi:MAG: PH domain-containing protein [Clostridium sp.]|nr:PH domain-containing protein [Clostridium sp.]